MESLVIFIVGYVILIVIIFILLQIIIPLLCTYFNKLKNNKKKVLKRIDYLQISKKIT